MNNFSECREIIPGLILGSVNDVEQMVEMGADVLVPLAYLDSDVWNTDFRGEILYCPIKDRGVLPFDVLRLLVNRILVRLDNEKKVALFCAGGHGRTGYVAGCVLVNKGIKDPIGFLRKEYSPHAIETDAQAEEILTYMEMLKAEMDDIYVPWIDSASKETNEKIKNIFVKFFEVAERKDIDIEYGDDISYPGEDVKYSTPEEGMAALMEDVQHFGITLDGELYGEAEEELRWIVEGIKSGRYKVDEETVKQLFAAIDERMNNL